MDRDVSIEYCETFFFRRCGHLYTRHLMNRYSLIGWFLKAVIGAFRRCVLSVVYSRKAILWLRFLIVGIHASGIFILLSLLIFFRWSLSCIANFTWRVQHWVSISIKFTSFQSRHCLQLWAYCFNSWRISSRPSRPKKIIRMRWKKPNPHSNKLMMMNIMKLVIHFFPSIFDFV